MSVSKSDRLKEELGWLKLVFAALIAIDVSLVAWLAQNYGKADSIIMIAGFLATVVVTSAVMWVNHLAYRRLKQLEDL